MDNLNKAEMAKLVELLNRAHKSGQFQVMCEGRGVGRGAIGVECWEDIPIMDDDGMVTTDETRDELNILVHRATLPYLKTGTPQNMAVAMHEMTVLEDG